MAKIFCCGTVTLDIINHVPHYPAEDEELRATAQDRRSGGNAANTAIVLARLGHASALAAPIATDDSGQWLLQRLARAGVDTTACPRLGGSTPTSYITLSSATGSRTIVHHRDLAELNAEALLQKLPSDLDWLHFEGRNIAELEMMLTALPATRGYRVSLEAEKPRPGLEALFDHADVVMLSRPWVEAKGLGDPANALATLHERHPGLLFTCTWGAAGVWRCDTDGNIIHTAPRKVTKIIDSIGAGDTFNAGLVHALVSNEPFGAAVEFANRLAAEKLARRGV